MNLLEEAKKHYSEQIYSITADLHAHPELSFEEKRTSAIIRAQLEKLGIEILDLGLETGVVGLLRGRGDATIALRADIDAIVQHEEYDRPDKSLTPGVAASAHPNDEKTMDARRGDAAERAPGRASRERALCVPAGGGKAQGRKVHA